MKKDYGIYQVALKILLKKGDKFLFLRGAKDRYWDWPGGRIDNLESRTPLAHVLAREVREELGKIKYKLGKPVFHYRRFFSPRKLFIFITVYEAKYISGAIKLSEEHSSCQWLNPKKHKFRARDFWSREEYNEFMRYLSMMK